MMMAGRSILSLAAWGYSPVTGGHPGVAREGLIISSRASSHSIIKLLTATIIKWDRTSKHKIWEGILLWKPQERQFREGERQASPESGSNECWWFWSMVPWTSDGVSGVCQSVVSYLAASLVRTPGLLNPLFCSSIFSLSQSDPPGWSICLCSWAGRGWSAVAQDGSWYRMTGILSCHYYTTTFTTTTTTTGTASSHDVETPHDSIGQISCFTKCSLFNTICVIVIAW